MSKPKWMPGDRLLLWEFQTMSPTTIIYDTFAHRATQAGILWGMTYRTLMDAFERKRYAFAIPIVEVKKLAHRYIHIAEPIGALEPKPVDIHISKPLPSTDGMTLEEVGEKIYEADAQVLADTLFYSLPQGTRIRLVRLLLKREVDDHGFFRGI